MKQGIVILLILGVTGIIFSSGCVQQKESQAPQTGKPAWMDIQLKDVATGNNFKISDFKGKPVLLESFAVWCPTCLKQQKEIKELKSREGDAMVYIALDTDPNEDEVRVREHLTKNNFDWYFAVAPIEITNALKDEFGLSIVNAPGTPVILICKDQSARFLRRGIKTTDDLLSEVNKGC